MASAEVLRCNRDTVRMLSLSDSAAWIRHASRARKWASAREYSGELVSNRWVMCPEVGDNTGKPVLIPHVILVTLVAKIKAVMRFRIGPPPIS